MAKELYDIIVIGAGPSGATAAKILAEKGFSVLIIEKCKLPRYKSCSGMVIAKTLELVDKYFHKNIPDSVKCTPFDNYGMVFVTDDAREYKFEQRGFNVWRSEFDFWLLNMALDCGAQLKEETSAVDVKEVDNCVEVKLDDSRRIKAKYVIDCEGAVGVIKRKLTGCSKDFIVTYQAYYEGTIDLDPHYFYAYLQPSFSQYDAWFNVKDGKPVLGVAVENIEEIEKYNQVFLKHLRNKYNLNITQKLKEEKWIMPRIRNGCSIDYGVGRILFAGEVAGFLNPMGEGISCGMESGFAAANAIADNLENSQNVLTSYRQGCQELCAYMKRQWHLTALMSNKFSHMKI